jgi:anti-sigma factor RsiW
VSEPATHARAFELLPWLVNGTLSGAEREAVEAHARACIACRRELKEQQRLHGALRARRTADVSAEAGFDRLERDLDPAVDARPWWRRRHRYAAFAPFAVSAAAGLAVLAILVWFTPLPQLDGSYSTLATAPTTAAPVLDVVFAEDTTAAEMQALLDEIGGEIVAGPSEVGRYSVRVPAAGSDAARWQKLLDALGADSRVRFAGRSLIEPAP